jgi:medium-chain acyl-[acyl-carrier-protein] hydrolase
VRLYCVPHAGGGASAFRAWGAALPGVEVRSVQLPGREDRIGEPALRSAAEIAGPLADALQDDGAPSGRWALFGHSMGALVGFEVLRELRRRGTPGPVHFFASGHRAPQLPDPDPPMHALSDDEFLDALDERYGGVPAAVRESDELLELLLPGLRADVSVCDTYEHVEEEPLDCPLTALGGERDRGVRREELEAWREQTRGEFRLEMFAGGHFYLQERETDVLRAVARAL